MASRYSVDAIFRAIDRFSAPVTRMQRKMRGLRRGMTRISGAVSGMAGKLGSMARYAGLAATALAGLAVRDVIKTGMEYEQAITNVGAVSLKTRDQIAELDAQAKKLGSTTKFTATEAANGMELMARAGFKQADIMAGIGGVLNAAAASGMELAETADHVANVLKGMGLETSEATRVADVLALASSKTNSTIGTLGESMRNVSATARQLNVPLEDVVAGVALLQDVGLDASVAGSSMNTMLTKLSKPPAAVAAQMKKMGVSFQDAEGNMLPLREVMANMAKAAQKSGGNMKQMAFFADLVGLRGQKAAANLKDLLLSGKFDELAESLRGSGGAAQKMADIKLQTLTGKFLILKSKIDAVKTSLFETNNGPLKRLLAGTEEWIDRNKYAFLAKAPGWMKDIEELFGDFSEGFMIGFEPLLDGFKGFWDAVSGADGSADLTKELFKNLGVLAGGLAGVVLVLGSVLAGIGYAIGVFLIGIKYVGEALGYAVYWLVNEFPTALGKMWDAIKDAAQWVWDGAKNLGIGLVDGFVGGLEGAWDWLKDTASRLVGGLWDAFKSALGISSPSSIAADLGQDIVQGFVKGLTDGWEALKNAASKFGKIVWEAIKKALDISSPSRKGLALGGNVGESVASGILGQRKAVQNAWSKLTGQLSASADMGLRTHETRALRLVHSVTSVQAPSVVNRPPQLRLVQGAERVAARVAPMSAMPERGDGHQYASPVRPRLNKVPDDITARSYHESAHTETERAELVVRDETGRAEMQKQTKGKRVQIQLKRTGTFD